MPNGRPDLAPVFQPGSLRDGEVVAAAAAAWIGSFAAAPVPPALVVAAVIPVIVGGRWRHPLVVVLAAGLLCSFLADRSLSGLAVPDDPAVGGRATLVTDPERFGAAVRADVRVDGHRYEVWLAGAHAGVVDELAVGDSFALSGRIRPPAPDDVAWFRPRHVVGRLQVATVDSVQSAGPPWSWANAVRDVLGRGLEVLDRDRRVLALGFLVGDDRGLDPGLEDDLRAAGLTHLSAVSGQNVAFVLALAQPAVRLLGRRSRFVALVAVLALFGFVTRWEPSVLRATVVAAVAVGGAFGGRAGGGVRHLALAVTGLLVIDPLLVWSVGFRLSVAASLGILTIGPRLAARLPGPRPLREALAVTIGAQLAVAPLLVTTFGPVPLASVPANLAAGPAAGLAMTWGLPAGLVAGTTGTAVATVLHVPTGLAVGWVAAVARWGAASPLPALGLPGVVAAAALLGVLVVGRRARRALGWLVAVAAFVAVGVAAARGPTAGHWAGAGIDVWRAGGAVVAVLDRPSPSAALGTLRAGDVEAIDLLVLRSPSHQTDDTADLIADRHRIRRRIGPSDLEGDRRRVELGELSVLIAAAGDRLDVGVMVAAAG